MHPGEQAVPESESVIDTVTGSDTFSDKGETEKNVKNLELKQKTTEQFQADRRIEAGLLNSFRNEMQYNPIYSKVSAEIKLNIEY